MKSSSDGDRCEAIALIARMISDGKVPQAFYVGKQNENYLMTSVEKEQFQSRENVGIEKLNEQRPTTDEDVEDKRDKGSTGRIRTLKTICGITSREDWALKDQGRLRERMVPRRGAIDRS